MLASKSSLMLSYISINAFFEIIRAINFLALHNDNIKSVKQL